MRLPTSSPPCPLPALLVLVSLLAVLLPGCMTRSSLRNAPGDAGEAEVFAASFDAVVDAVTEAMEETGLEIQDSYGENETTYVIIGATEPSVFDWGQYARVIVEQTDTDVVTVRVHRKDVLVTEDEEKQESARAIFSRLDRKLRN